VTSLIDENLLRRVERSGGQIRLAMLETIREYALERLLESDEAEAVRRAHARYYLALAEEAEPELVTAEQMRWLDLLESEHNNSRAALRWSLQSEDTQTTLRLAGASWRFWYVRGHLSEGRRWVEEALALDGEAPSLRTRVLGGGANCRTARATSTGPRSCARGPWRCPRGLGTRPDLTPLSLERSRAADTRREWVRLPISVFTRVPRKLGKPTDGTLSPLVQSGRVDRGEEKERA
jgi:hypothetical protein